MADPPERVWQFFQEITRVGGCVPGVEQVTPVDADRFRVLITQKVGFIKATFDVDTRVGAREPLQFMELASVGRSVRGAAGDVRFKNRIEFAPDPGGGTQITLSSEVALGGMLGALGHKVVAARARDITEQFAAALRSEIQKWASAS